MHYDWPTEPKRHERRASRLVWAGFLLVMVALALEWLLHA